MLFFSERLRGSCVFASSFAALPIPAPARRRAVARWLGVTERTVSDWLSGRREPPPAAVAAIWHESPHGRAVTAAHSEYGQRLASGYADSLARELDAARATIADLLAELDALKRTSAAPVASNDPAFSWCIRDRRPRSGAPCIHA